MLINWLIARATAGRQANSVTLAGLGASVEGARIYPAMGGWADYRERHENICEDWAKLYPALANWELKLSPMPDWKRYPCSMVKLAIKNFPVRINPTL